MVVIFHEKHQVMQGVKQRVGFIFCEAVQGELSSKVTQFAKFMLREYILQRQHRIIGDFLGRIMRVFTKHEIIKRYMEKFTYCNQAVKLYAPLTALYKSGKGR